MCLCHFVTLSHCTLDISLTRKEAKTTEPINEAVRLKWILILVIMDDMSCHFDAKRRILGPLNKKKILPHVLKIRNNLKVSV